MEKVTCTIRGVRWADTSDPRNYPYLFGSEMPVQKGLCRYTVEIDLLHAPLPSQLTQEELHVLAQRLQGVRQQAAASYDLDKRIAALQERRRDYEEKRADAEARAEKFREEAAYLDGQGEDAVKEKQAALLADEDAKSFKKNIDKIPTERYIQAGLFNLLESRLATEAERIRTEATARAAAARQRLAAAVKDFVLEVALADAGVRLVQAASGAERAIYGSSASWLDKQVTDLGLVPGFVMPRPSENYTAPVPRGF
jgi:hypothetical protein